MYRTLYFRWVISIFNAKGTKVKSQIYYATRYVSQKKFLELEGMLFDGALLLFSHQETASGVIELECRLLQGVQNVPFKVDLAKLYVETLTQAEAGPEEARFQRLSK